MTVFELVIVLFAVVLVLALIGRGRSTPLPVIFAVGGLVMGFLWRFVPQLPRFSIAPTTALALFLPPLVAAAASSVPLGAFRANLRPITMLAVVLLLVTMVAAAPIARDAVPGLPWAAALALGAIVAPPDPVAATAVARSLGLRNRLVTILSGEGLINDATALVAYEVAISAAVTGHFSWLEVAVELLRAVPVGVVVGLGMAWLAAEVLRRLNDPVVETAISLMVPYLTYIAADHLGGSTILALVALGFYLRSRKDEMGEPATRLASRAVWRVVEFSAEGLVFVLVGVEIGQVFTLGAPIVVLEHAGLVILVVVLLRMAWMYVVPSVLQLVSHRVKPIASLGELTVLGWSGMRGVVSLVLALSIPRRLASGAPFPGRSELIVIALSVVLATLIGQGLTLAPLIRFLGVGHPEQSSRQEEETRTAAIQAARQRLEALAASHALSPEQRDNAIAHLTRDVGLAREQSPDAHSRRLRQALLLALAAERDVVVRRRNNGLIADDSAERLQEILDAEEFRIDEVIAHQEDGDSGFESRSMDA